MKLAWFYQQYKIEDFLAMDIRLFNILSLGMEQMIAEQQIRNMDFAIYPHIDDKGRRSSHKSWYKKAYPESFESRVVKTTDLELI